MAGPTTEEFLGQFEIGRLLGSGAFSEVREVVLKETGEKFAMKIIDKQQSQQEDVSIETEINILKKVRHPNIIALFDVHEGPSKIYLIMELVTGGELFDRIVDKGHFTEEDGAYIIRKILEAVDYLHQNDIAHRDLKPENLLLSDPSETARVMISDFGLSKVLSDEEMMKTACGTPGYVAPEVLNYVGYGKEVDIWAIGVIAYVLLCGYAPFFGEKDSDLFAAIMGAVYEFDSPYWDEISNEAKDFIDKLLQVDTKKRLTAKEALQHPWLKKSLNRAPSVKALHPSYRSQLYRTTSQKTKKDNIKETVDAAIGIRRKGTTKKEQEENAERRKKAIEEKKNEPDIEEDGPVGIGATLRAKLGLKPKEKKDKDKDKDEKKEKRKSKAKDGGA